MSNEESSNDVTPITKFLNQESSHHSPSALLSGSNSSTSSTMELIPTTEGLLYIESDSDFVTTPSTKTIGPSRIPPCQSFSLGTEHKAAPRQHSLSTNPIESDPTPFDSLVSQWSSPAEMMDSSLGSSPVLPALPSPTQNHSSVKEEPGSPLQIYLGNLPPEMTGNDIQLMLSPFGELLRCHRVKPSLTKNRRHGSAFATFRLRQDAERAIDILNGKFIEGGQQILVEIALNEKGDEPLGVAQAHIQLLGSPPNLKRHQMSQWCRDLSLKIIGCNEQHIRFIGRCTSLSFSSIEDRDIAVLLLLQQLSQQVLIAIYPTRLPLVSLASMGIVRGPWARMPPQNWWPWEQVSLTYPGWGLQGMAATGPVGFSTQASDLICPPPSFLQRYPEGIPSVFGEGAPRIPTHLVLCTQQVSYQPPMYYMPVSTRGGVSTSASPLKATDGIYYASPYPSYTQQQQQPPQPMLTPYDSTVNYLNATNPSVSPNKWPTLTNTANQEMKTEPSTEQITDASANPSVIGHPTGKQQ